jgi:Fe-S oxidoreductase
MAGAFGMSAEKHELSAKVAAPMLAHLAAAPNDAMIIASGTSCRQQIQHLSPRKPLHMAEWLAAALV